MRIFVSSKFKRKYKKLTKSVKTRAKTRERIFKANIFHPSLQTHKLHGKERKCWSYSIDNIYRIKFLFIDSRTVLYLDVGTHDEVY